MGNLEKVLIVVILVTISVITVLAFLESADDAPDEIDLGRRESPSAAAEDDPGTAPADSRAPGRGETSVADRESDRGSDLAAFFHDRATGDDVENATQIPDDAGVGPASPGPREGSAPDGTPDSPEAVDDDAPGRAPNAEGRPAPAGEGDPPGSNELPGSVEPAAPPSGSVPDDAPGRPGTAADVTAPVAPQGWEPGSPRYVTERTQSWNDIATVVYGDSTLAAGLRAANTDVATDRVVPGTALWIPTRVEARELAASLRALRARDASERGGETGDEGEGPANGSETWHVVEKGETLSEISRLYFGTPNRWREILDANRDRVESDRALKYGTRLRIPKTEP